MTTDTFDPDAAIEELRPIVAEILALDAAQLDAHWRDARARGIADEAIRTISEARRHLIRQRGDGRKDLAAFTRALGKMRAMQARLDRQARGDGYTEPGYVEPGYCEGEA